MRHDEPAGMRKKQKTCCTNKIPRFRLLAGRSAKASSDHCGGASSDHAPRQRRIASSLRCLGTTVKKRDRDSCRPAAASRARGGLGFSLRATVLRARRAPPLPPLFWWAAASGWPLAPTASSPAHSPRSAPQSTALTRRPAICGGILRRPEHRPPTTARQQPLPTPKGVATSQSWRPAAAGPHRRLGVDVRLPVQQQSRHRLVSAPRRQHHRRDPALVFRLHLHALLQQQRHRRHVAVRRRVHQRRPPHVVAHVRARPLLQQQRHHLLLAVASRERERSFPVLLAGPRDGAAPGLRCRGAGPGCARLGWAHWGGADSLVRRVRTFVFASMSAPLARSRCTAATCPFDAA